MTEETIIAPVAEEPKTEELSGIHKLISEKFSSDNIRTGQDAEDKINWLLDYYDKSEEANKLLNELFEEEPGLIKAIAEYKMGKHKNMPSALASNYDIELFVPTKDEPGHEEMMKIVADRRANVENEKKSAEEFKNNLAASIDALDEYKSKNGVADEEFNEFMNVLDELLMFVAKGKLSDKVIDHMWKGFRSKFELENAYKEGEKAGMNMKIVAIKGKETPSGDGVPSPVPTDIKPVNQPKPKTYKSDWKSVLPIEERK